MTSVALIACVRAETPGFQFNCPKLHLWCVRGHLRPREVHPGSGKPRVFPLEELYVAIRMARYMASGLPPDAAHRAARNGGVLAPGVRLVITEPAA